MLLLRLWPLLLRSDSGLCFLRPPLRYVSSSRCLRFFPLDRFRLSLDVDLDDLYPLPLSLLALGVLEALRPRRQTPAFAFTEDLRARGDSGEREMPGDEHDEPRRRRLGGGDGDGVRETGERVRERERGRRWCDR